MENKLKLFMVLLGCTPKGRLTEQHDVFFGIGKSLKDLLPQMNEFWHEANGKIHVDAWREVTVVDGFSIEITPKNEILENENQLFFVNLGGYKENEFEEYHYKMLSVAKTVGLASKESRKSTFYKHCGFKGADSHIDDKFGIDVDEIYCVSDILDSNNKTNFGLKISKIEGDFKEDILHIGYLKISTL